MPLGVPRNQNGSPVAFGLLNRWIRLPPYLLRDRLENAQCLLRHCSAISRVSADAERRQRLTLSGVFNARKPLRTIRTYKVPVSP